MNINICLFFDSEDFLRDIPEAVVQNFVVPVIFRGHYLLAVVVGRDAQHANGPAEFNNSLIPKIIGNDKLLKAAHAIGVKSIEDGQANISAYRTPDAIVYSTLLQMTSDVLKELPPVWTGTLQKTGWPQIPARPQN